jgi:hypothetical protein
MNSQGVSNLYLDSFMKKISISFRGTFSCDNIPIFKESNIAVISNLSREQDIGSHFIAFFISDDTIIYFDPFGIENYNISIEEYLKKYKKQIIYSEQRIQAYNSSHCGYFCVIFILCLDNNVSLRNFLELFNKNDLLINDYVCIELIKEYIKHMYLRNQN